MRKNNVQTCIAGEYYVLAELARRDAVASLTIHNTKGVDILVASPNRRIAYKVEVKTSRMPPGRHTLWHGDEKCLQWRMGVKHETMRDPNLIYAFGWLPDHGSPRFFLVPSREVARYVRWEHAHWLKDGKEDTSEDWRIFRIPESNWRTYENNWKLLGIRD